MPKNIISTFLLSASLCALGQLAVAQQRSSNELVQQAVNALAAKDQGTLDKLTIDQAEFQKYVWPSIASRASGADMNAGKNYNIYRKSSQLGIEEAGVVLAGHKWEVVKVAVEPACKSKNHQLHSAPRIALRDDAGAEKTLQLMGGLLERDGVYKVTTFYVSGSKRAEK